MNYQELAAKLFRDQGKSWDFLRDNLEGLKYARIRKLSFDGYSINIQFNPKRIISSAAKVDNESIQQRQCFLCSVNRPREQESVIFNKDYEILCNPYPIFMRHYTIAKFDHVPQSIEDSFSDMLDLSKALPDLVVFYNGPKCGASAPDHLHFQAGNLGFLPMEQDYEAVVKKYGRTVMDNHGMSVTSVDDGLRRFFTVESPERERISGLFSIIYRQVSKGPEEEEPMMNILSWYDEQWRIMIFLRQNHRPWQFFTEGGDNILISPAGVDYGGTMIMPMEKDFNKISRKDIRDIFQQVSYPPGKFRELEKYLSSQR